MNYKYVCALALLCTLTTNSLIAQTENVQKAMLAISYQKNDNSNQKEYLHLFKEEAYQFDVADFLSKNKYQDIQIKGTGTINNEKVSWAYESDPTNEDCHQYIEYVSSIEKTPFLGVSVIATDDFTGARVSTIIEGSSAAASGLQVGDVITLINNFEITNPCEVTEAVGQSMIGDPIDIDILRAEANERLETNLGFRLHKTMSWKPNCAPSIIALEADNANTQNAELSVYPNPTGGMVQVKYSATQTGTVQMNLTDLMGRLVIVRTIEQFSGMYEEMLDLKGMQDGVYFLNIQQGDEVRTEKIVLQKG